MSTHLSETAEMGDGVLERPVSFQVAGSWVRGIYSWSGSVKPERAVVFSHGWSGFRDGPGGILLEAARSLSRLGFACLRFDFRGRGESGGNGLTATLATMSQDLTGAVEWLRQEQGICRVSLFGMCSGGNIAIASLKSLPGIERMVLLSVYPFSDGDNFSRDVNRSWHFVRTYALKACSLKNWKRLVTGDASLSRVFSVIFRPFLKRGENKVKEEGRAALGSTVKASKSESRLQSGKEPPKKYLSGMRTDLPVLMVYGDGDPDASAAFKYYSDYAAEKHLPVKFSFVEGANHNFSSIAWRRRIIDLVDEFAG